MYFMCNFTAAVILWMHVVLGYSMYFTAAVILWMHVVIGDGMYFTVVL